MPAGKSQAPRATILSPEPENIARAAQALVRGDVVGMPTETVYGLAGNALNPEALTRIFETKERPTFDPLIVHVAPRADGKPETVSGLETQGLVDAAALSPAALERANRLMQAFWPGPLTLVLPKKKSVPDLCTSGLANVAIRMPRHPVAQALIREARLPLAAPSANRFGRVSPTSAQAVMEELGDRIEWILDGGRCEIGVESTVVAVASDGRLALLRPGGLPRSEIEEVAGVALESAQKNEPLAAPGMLESHYAPSKPVFLLPAPASQIQANQLRQLLSGAASRRQGQPIRKLGLLVLSGTAIAAEEHFANALGFPVTALSLSAKGDAREIARNLFAGLRELDSKDVDAIFSETCPIDEGLGHAIADRLKRAAAQK